MYQQQIFTISRENTKYAYAVGLLRVLETRLLGRAAIARLLEAGSAQEVLKMLSEGEYEVALLDVHEPWDFERALNVERERVYALIDRLTLDQRLTQIFRMRWDFHNLKVLLKSNYLGRPGTGSDDILVRSGLVPVEDPKAAIKPEGEQKVSKLPEYISNALKDAKVEYEETQNPQILDIVIDKHAQRVIYQQVTDYPNPFLRGYFEAVADLTNIKSFIRLKMLGEGLRTLDSVLLPHGILDRSIYIKRFDDSIESFVESLANTSYGKVVADGLKGWTEHRSLAAYERLSDDYLINYIKPAKYIVFGVEPLIGYLLAKENEMKLIRIIMIGKLNDLPYDVIKERLRDTYV